MILQKKMQRPMYYFCRNEIKCNNLGKVSKEINAKCILLFYAGFVYHEVN